MGVQARQFLADVQSVRQQGDFLKESPFFQLLPGCGQSFRKAFPQGLRAFFLDFRRASGDDLAPFLRGENKDSSQMTEEQIAIYQEQVDEYYSRFVEIVADGRGMTEDGVKALADGRTYTASQAKENGLIDEIALYDDMKTAMSEELGVDQFYELKHTSDMLSSLFAQAKEMVPKSEAQILTETAQEMESGVPMYYAEQLQ